MHGLPGGDLLALLEGPAQPDGPQALQTTAASLAQLLGGPAAAASLLAPPDRPATWPSASGPNAVQFLLLGRDRLRVQQLAAQIAQAPHHHIAAPAAAPAPRAEPLTLAPVICLPPAAPPATGQGPGGGIALWQRRLVPPGPPPENLPAIAGPMTPRMLASLAQDIAAHGPITRAMRLAACRLVLPLTLRQITSPQIGRLQHQAQAAGLSLGAEVPLAEMLHEPSLWAEARNAAATGFGLQPGDLQLGGLQLGGLHAAALRLLRPQALAARLAESAAQIGLVLAFDSALAAIRPGRGPAAAAIAALNPDRIILAGAADEAAIAWGRGHGLRLFAGSFAGLLLAASRKQACPAGQGCTPRQCARRAQTPLPPGRDGCAEPGRLDNHQAPPPAAPWPPA